MERGRERVNRLPTCYLGLAGNLWPAKARKAWAGSEGWILEWAKSRGAGAHREEGIGVGRTQGY